MGTLSQWLRHSSAARPLGHGKRFHVSISYRYNSPACALRLYDVPRLPKYDLFIGGCREDVARTRAR